MLFRSPPPHPPPPAYLPLSPSPSPSLLPLPISASSYPFCPCLLLSSLPSLHSLSHWWLRRQSSVADISAEPHNVMILSHSGNKKEEPIHKDLLASWLIKLYRYLPTCYQERINLDCNDEAFHTNSTDKVSGFNAS